MEIGACRRWPGRQIPAYRQTDRQLACTLDLLLLLLCVFSSAAAVDGYHAGAEDERPPGAAASCPFDQGDVGAVGLMSCGHRGI